MGLKKRPGRASNWRICPCGNHLWHTQGGDFGCFGIATKNLIEGSIVRVKVERCRAHRPKEG